MHFKHYHGVVRKKGNRPFMRGLFLVLSGVMFVGGVYLLLLVMTPNIPAFFPVQEIDAKRLPVPSEDRVYIPKIGISVTLHAGGPEVLEEGAWHRFPERGDPEEGGNFIVSAHRFSLGVTPDQTRRKSPFYHIDKLAVGDQIIVDFKGKRYAYAVEEAKNVAPDQVEIESETDEPRLTLYTCTLKGESDGREVFFAKPLGEVVDGAIAA